MHSIQTTLPSILFLYTSAGCSTTNLPHSLFDADNGGDGASDSLPAISVEVSGSVPRAISPFFYGQNYWKWVAGWGGVVTSTAPQAKSMGVQFLRAGGINNDTNNWDSPDPVHRPFDDAQIDAFVAYAADISAVPLLQVPMVKAVDGTIPTPASTAAMVAYVNKTKGYGIKYFSVGNEPDTYTDLTFRSSSYEEKDFCAEFAPLADAVRPFHTRVSPALVFTHHLEHQLDDLSGFPGSPGSTVLAPIVFLRHLFSIPSQDRVGRRDS
jgi:hypothetical protein